MKELYAFVLAGLMIAIISRPGDARGRQPSEDDPFPNYNRLEFQQRLPDPAAQEPTAASFIPPRPQPASASTSTPVSEMIVVPPPQAVPLSADASEPPMPDEITNTLSTATTSHVGAPLGHH